MDYLEQTETFYKLLPDCDISPYGICLWHGLMHIFRLNGWKNQLQIPLKDIIRYTKLSRCSVYRERIRLCKAGLIRYAHPAGVLHGHYEMLPISEEIMHKINEELSLTETESSLTQTTKSPTETTMFHTETRTAHRETTPENAYKVVPNNNIISKVDIQRNKENQKRKKKVKPSSDAPANPAGKKEKSCAKKERKGAPTFKQDEWLATLQEPWQGLMRQWLEYKAARKETYKTEVGARKCLTLLQNLSGNNPQVAQLIIDQSIGNNYAGLFALRQQNTASRTQVPQTGQRIGQIKQPETEEKRKRLLERFAQSGRKTDDENK